MKYKLTLTSALPSVILFSCLNANAFTDEQLLPERLYTNYVTVSCNMTDGSLGMMQRRRVYELMPDGTHRYVYAGNGQYSTVDYRTDNGTLVIAAERDTGGDGFQAVSDCYQQTVTMTRPNKMKPPVYTVSPAPISYQSVIDTITEQCPAGQSGNISRKRYFTKWVNNKDYPLTDLLNLYVSNTCKDLTYTTQTQIAQESCPEGQIGTVEKTRTYDLYSDGAIKNESAWSVTGNSCVATPKETVTPYHFEVTCDSYYGVAKGSYTGMVMKSGNNVTNASGETTFNLVSTDTSSCVKQFSDVKETISETACPDGQTGTILSAVYTAESGSGTVYPYGQAPVVKSNTCVTPLDSGSIANPEAATSTAAKSAVLSNMSFTVSQLSADGEALAAEISQFDSTKSEGTHTFNIVANSLNAKTLNATNVTKVIKAYKKASGDSNTFVKVGGLSQSLYDYIGQAGLTAQKISSEKLVLLSSNEESGLVTVKYASYLNPLKAGDVQSFTVKIYNP